MTEDVKRVGFFRAIYELTVIMTLRFKMLPRAWILYLMLVNLLSVVFLKHIEGQAVFAAMCIGGVIMGLVYQKFGFVRLLGVGHLQWVPLVYWLNTRLVVEAHDDVRFRAWITLIVLTNSVSLIMDAIDMLRYLKGEREPYYKY